MTERTAGAPATEAKAVLDFWFSDTARKNWFRKDAAFDREIRDRFAAAQARAAAGALAGREDTPESALALVILLDQFPRNMFRDSPRAFATDAAAQEVVDRALARGFDQRLPLARRSFLFMPFMHSESIADQDRCVSLFETLGKGDTGLEYALSHRDIIARFGRFPHRNAVLDRENTPEEADFLEKPGSSF